jgi:hypothetical protein
MRWGAIVALGLAAGCGRPRPPAPIENAAPCDPATPTLTIVTGPLRPGCTGGMFTIDGQVRGMYPVRCAPAIEGEHWIGVPSRDDCAGMGSCKVTFVAGRETVLDLRTAVCH